MNIGDLRITGSNMKSTNSIVIVFAASALSSNRPQTDNKINYADASIYVRLENLSETKAVTSDTSAKMNNEIEKNSNPDVISISLPSDYNISTIKVYDHTTGTFFTQPIEEYTLCALIAEMPQSFEPEALKAQAVAARTFAIRNAVIGSKHKDADICTDYRCCQSYKRLSDITFDITKASEAVNATSGIIAVYNGEPILAAYHSSSVGYTKASKDVWGGDVSYLVPVIAAEPKESAVLTTVISKENVQKVLAKYGISGNYSFSHTNDGLCTGVSSNGVYVSAADLKRAFSLRSDTFEVSFSGGKYTFKNYGYGHGVGMSQYGADALAKQGYDFYEILKYYYTGIEFDFIA